MLLSLVVLFVVVPSILILAWKISGILMGVAAIAILYGVYKFRRMFKPKARWQ